MSALIEILYHPSLLADGLPFSLTLLAILLAHELGHYLTCVWNGIDVSLPYFIPAPTFIGTFGAFIRIRSPIYSKRVLFDVGLGYLRLGQSATTLSGGEAQRIKLSRELAKRTNSNTLYILDEPTIGLHFADIQKLLDVLVRLVGMGNTVVVIEHNLDIIKCADHIIDLGPEGGPGGGRIVASGTPEAIAATEASFTGQYLRTVLPRAGTDQAFSDFSGSSMKGIVSS